MRYWIALRVALRVGFALYKLVLSHRSELEWIVKAGKDAFAHIINTVKKELEEK